MEHFEALISLERDARAYGFDWPDCETVIAQAISECEEIKEAIDNKEPRERIQEEIGDLMHTALSLCLFAGFDAEETLAIIVRKFGARMAAIKALTAHHGLKNLQGQPTDFLMELWRQVKANELNS